jgi:hypothetical protein
MVEIEKMNNVKCPINNEQIKKGMVKEVKKIDPAKKG